jgi:hypothetical protein
MKNAKALHIIQISCGRHIQNELFHFHDAKLAWFYLGSRYGRNSSEVYESRQGTYIFFFYNEGTYYFRIY